MRLIAVGVALRSRSSLRRRSGLALQRRTPAVPEAPAATSGLADDGGIDPGTKFSPVFASTLAAPAAVKATDGKVHLAYELLITNAAALALSKKWPLTLTR